MPKLEGTKTHDNLKEAFAGESQANRRYLYFAQKADVEGHPDIAALFRSVAEGETGHAFGHFDFLAEVGDPVTGVPVGSTTDNLRSDFLSPKVTATGGRLLTVVATGKTISEARQTVYRNIERIQITATQYRRDIGARET